MIPELGNSNDARSRSAILESRLHVQLSPPPPPSRLVVAYRVASRAIVMTLKANNIRDKNGGRLLQRSASRLPQRGVTVSAQWL